MHGITQNDIDHLMIYDAFAASADLRPRRFGLQIWVSCRAARLGRFIAEHNAPGGKLRSIPMVAVCPIQGSPRHLESRTVDGEA